MGLSGDQFGDLAGLLSRCTFPEPGSRVDCAVSGGADSLSLLFLACEAGCEVTAIHVDHGLRAGSDREADVVRAVAERFGAGFRSERVTLAPGANLEARARAARYEVLPAEVMTGHTADDQSETMLLNLLRGAGPDGMAGMRTGIRHPILALRRFETVELCRSLSIDVVQDPSNVNPAFRRNRVRHELLPLLTEILDRDPVPVLARQAGIFRSVSDYLAAEASGLDVTDASKLADAPEIVAATAVRHWLRCAHTDGQPPDQATVARVLAVARLEVRATDIGRGWRVERTRGRLRLVAPSSELDPDNV